MPKLIFILLQFPTLLAKFSQPSYQKQKKEKISETAISTLLTLTRWHVPISPIGYTPCNRPVARHGRSKVVDAVQGWRLRKKGAARVGGRRGAKKRKESASQGSGVKCWKQSSGGRRAAEIPRYAPGHAHFRASVTSSHGGGGCWLRHWPATASISRDRWWEG